MIKPQQVAAQLGVKVGTLAKWRVFGKGPMFVKLGTRIAYEVEAIEAYIAAGRRRSTSMPTLGRERVVKSVVAAS